MRHSPLFFIAVGVVVTVGYYHFRNPSTGAKSSSA